MNKMTTGVVIGIAVLRAAGGVSSAKSGTGHKGHGSRGAHRRSPHAWMTARSCCRRPGSPSRRPSAPPGGAAQGALNEVDLEHDSGRLVFTVDVGSSDVKVDAGSGKVLSIDQDD